MAYRVRVAAVQRIPENPTEFTVTVEVIDDKDAVLAVRTITATTGADLTDKATVLRDSHETMALHEALRALIGQVIVN